MGQAGNTLDLSYFECRRARGWSRISILLSDVVGKGSMDTSKLSGRAIDRISVFRERMNHVSNPSPPDEQQDNADEDEGQA
jgi:hypothetical protein